MMRQGTRTARRLLPLMLLAVTGAGPALAQDWALPPKGYAYKPSAPCLEDPVRAAKPIRPGAAVYAVCDDQMALLVAAIDKARRDGKLLIVTVGATWCPWCAALQRLMPGPEFFARQGDRIDYRRTFDHIEIGVSTTHKGRNTLIPSGQAVEENLMARAGGGELTSIPFVFMIDPVRPDRVFSRHTRDLSDFAKGEQNMAGFRKIVLEGHDFLRAGGQAQGR